MPNNDLCRHTELDGHGERFRCSRTRKGGSDYCWAHDFPHTSGRVGVSEQLELAVTDPTGGYPPF